MSKKYRLNKEELVKEFKPLVREQKIVKYDNLIEYYNNLTDAFNEINQQLNNQTNKLKEVDGCIETINAVLRRLGFPDRITDIYTLGSTISNFLWKRKHVSETRSMPEVQEQGQSRDLF